MLMDENGCATITDGMWYKMCGLDMSRPVPLGVADLSLPFVYERRFGVFYVPFGRHQGAMALLLTFQHNSTNIQEVAKKLGLSLYGTKPMADYWLHHTPGAAFKSSTGGRIQIGSRKNMTSAERMAFKEANLVFDALHIE